MWWEVPDGGSPNKLVCPHITAPSMLHQWVWLHKLRVRSRLSSLDHLPPPLLHVGMWVQGAYACVCAAVLVLKEQGSKRDAEPVEFGHQTWQAFGCLKEHIKALVSKSNRIAELLSIKFFDFIIGV